MSHEQIHQISEWLGMVESEVCRVVFYSVEPIAVEDKSKQALGF
jgi:hypothetical protein